MSSPRTGPTVRRWLAGPLPKDVESALRRTAKLPDVRHVAVMPDVHLAHDVCVGTVLATGRLIYPAAVGGDIGCGIAAVAFACGADVLAGAAAAGRVLARLPQAVPVNRHARPHDLPHELAAAGLSHPRLESLKRRDGRVQFGTLGRGNHFLEFQSDEEGRLWLMVHSGSRAMGQAIRDHHVAQAGQGHGAGASLRCAPAALPADVLTSVRTFERPVDSPDEEGSAGASGRRTPHDSHPAAAAAVAAATAVTSAAPGAAASAYLADAGWARAYADASRRAMLDAATGVLGALFGVRRLDETLVACDHNHVRRETHFGEPCWVHRKGAASARAGEPGIIPGSMGAASFLVEGRGEPGSLRSSSHGAGRAMSRDEARRRVSARELSRQLHGVWFDPRAAPRLREEAPSAYKDIGAVLRAQRDLVRIVRTLRPVLSYKGT